MAKKKPRRSPSPDDGLATENFGELNQTFYATEPQAYLRRRLLNLLLTRANGTDLEELASKGIKIGIASFDYGFDEESEELRERFAIAESEVLLSHVSETVIRIYLAHHQIPSCPWLELGRVRSPSKFKSNVEKLLIDLEDGSEDERIQSVFYGQSNRMALEPEIDEESWYKTTVNLNKYLTYFAETALDSNVYNAAKHGLALVAGSSSIELQPHGDPEPLVLAEGPALECLVVAPDEQGRRRWAREARWIDPDRAATHAWMGCQMLDSIWTMGKARYLEAKFPLTLRSYASFSFDEIDGAFGADGPAITTDRMTIPLIYYAGETSSSGT